MVIVEKWRRERDGEVVLVFACCSGWTREHLTVSGHPVYVGVQVVSTDEQLDMAGSMVSTIS